MVAVQRVAAPGPTLWWTDFRRRARSRRQGLQGTEAMRKVWDRIVESVRSLGGPPPMAFA
jgi:hypothetical protein